MRKDSLEHNVLTYLLRMRTKDGASGQCTGEKLWNPLFNLPSFLCSDFTVGEKNLYFNFTKLFLFFTYRFSGNFIFNSLQNNIFLCWQKFSKKRNWIFFSPVRFVSRIAWHGLYGWGDALQRLHPSIITSSSYIPNWKLKEVRCKFST